MKTLFLFAALAASLFAQSSGPSTITVIGQTGAKGDTGTPGPQGPAGSSTGTPGPPGPTGPAGPQGIPGPTGPAGSGSGLSFSNPTGFRQYLYYPAGAKAPQLGIIQATDVQGLSSVGGSPGPAGPIGPIGPPGPMGPQGPAGPSGTGTGTGSGASQSNQLTDLRLARMDATHDTMGATCTATASCNVRFNDAVLKISTQASVTLSGNTSGVLFAWLDSTGAYNVGYPLGTTIACTGCNAVQATAFPPGSFPLGTSTFTVGAFDATGITDFRPVYGRDVVMGSTGVIVSRSGANVSVGVDTTLFAQLVPVPASASSACSVPSWAYDSSFIYVCVGPNSWQRTATATW